MHVDDLPQTCLEVVIVNHTARILDLEKQVTQLRADIAALNKEQPNEH
jgi:hypothetical protein